MKEAAENSAFLLTRPDRNGARLCGALALVRRKRPPSKAVLDLVASLVAESAARRFESAPPPSPG
jgi:hypothetical protein